MTNMGYCRWHNTSFDFDDCIEALREADSPEAYYRSLSSGEKAAFKQLLTEAYSLMDDMDIFEHGLDEVLETLDKQKTGE